MTNPAEAATRENGDLVTRVEKIIRERKISTDGPNRADWQLGYAAACRELRDLILPILSTHQQQGAESELVKRLRSYSGLDLADKTHWEGVQIAALMKEAADALSRATQPDTVTVERELFEELRNEAFEHARPDTIKKADAALAARGKA